MTTELAKDAFTQQNFLLAHEFYETSLVRNCNRKTERAKNVCSKSNRGCISETNLDLFYGYGDSLAKLGRLKESFDVYAHICQQFHGIVPVDSLKCLAISLIEQIRQLLVTTWRSNNLSGLSNNLSNDDMISDNCSNVDTQSIINRITKNPIDPLLCSICEDILKYPVTSICGHTFCRQCCFGRTECFVCGHNFFINSNNNDSLSSSSTSTSSSVTEVNQLHQSSSTALTTILATSSSSSASTSTFVNNCANNTLETTTSDIYTQCISFEQDVLIRRLVEKWWDPLLRATELNDEAQRHLESNALDAALKCCNQSLEYGKYQYISSPTYIKTFPPKKNMV